MQFRVDISTGSLTIYIILLRIVYGKGAEGFTTEDIYNNLQDKRFSMMCGSESISLRTGGNIR